MTRVLVTRPREDAERLVAELRARGVDGVIAPLIEIVPRADAVLDLDGVGAVLLTSANGARALAALTPRRDLRVLAVGAATAATLKELGFPEPESAGGDVTDLARLAGERLRPEAGDLLHVAGGDVAGDLAGLLGAKGFRVRRVVAYDAKPVTALPDVAADALRAGAIDAVLLFSPRTAATFVSLVRAANLERALASVEALCLSPAVADDVAGLTWRKVRTAAQPEQSALLALLPKTDEPETPVDERPSLPPPETAPRRRRRWPVVVGALVVGVLGLAGFIAVERLRALDPRLAALEADVARLAQAPAQPTVSAADVADLAQRLAALETQVQALDAAPPPAPDPRVADLERRLADLERRLADLGDRVDAVGAVPAAADARTEGRLAAMEAALGGGVARADVGRLDRRADDLAADVDLLRDVLDTVATRIAALEAGDRRRPLVALVVAVGQLRDAVRRDGPFGPELAAVRELAGRAGMDLADIAPLEPLAAAGVPTAADLGARFADVVTAALAPAPAPAAPWYRQALDRLAGLVTVRRVGGDVTGDDAEARLARAEARLADGDLAGATAEVAAIGATDPMTVAWLADARARLGADAAITRLGERVIAAVAADTP